MGLLLRYLTDKYENVRLSFADSITLNESGSVEEFYFSQLYGHSSQESEGDGEISGRSLSQAHEQERVS